MSIAVILSVPIPDILLGAIISSNIYSIGFDRMLLSSKLSMA